VRLLIGAPPQATFFVEGVAIGNHSGYMDGFELPLPPSLLGAAAGRQVGRGTGRDNDAGADDASAAGGGGSVRISVRLDGTHCPANNSATTQCGCGGLCFSSANSGPWAGIWGNIELAQLQPLALTQVTVRTLSLDTPNNTDQATVEVTAELGNGLAPLRDQAALLRSARLRVVLSEHATGKVSTYGSLL